MLLYAIQDALLYYPNTPEHARSYVQSPHTLGLDAENLFINTSDNVRLHALFIGQPVIAPRVPLLWATTPSLLTP